MVAHVRGSGPRDRVRVGSSMTRRRSVLAGALAACLLGSLAVTADAQSESPAPPSSSATAGPAASDDAMAFVGTNPPDGSYRADIDYLDLVSAGAATSFAQANQGPWIWTFSEGTFALKHLGYGEDCGGTYESDGTRVRLVNTIDAGCVYDGDIQWAPAPEGIRFRQLASEGASDDLTDMAAFFDRVFVRVETPA
jgi:hypothetical protein